MPRLRRSDPAGPGLRRRRAGRGFVYVDENGRRVTDAATLDRIRALAVPPAWEDVWICSYPGGHIQAVGTDARGRRQYRYHDEWRARRDRDKFDHVLDVARALPGLRAACSARMAGGDLDRDRVLSAAVRLLDIGFFRIGGEEYAETNGSYGLATLLRVHARVRGDLVVFDYPAKSGRERIQSVADPDVCEIVTALKRRRGGGPELLAYKQDGRWRDVTSSDINAYLKELSGIDITAKDFRTWNATVLAALALAVSWRAQASPRMQERAIRRAVCEASDYLGNTPAVCRTSYIDPRVIDLYRDGITVRPVITRLGQDAPPGGLVIQGSVERAVLNLLTRHTAHSSRSSRAA